MLGLRLRKIGSLLGLLAILMAAIAPTISQAVAAQHRLETLLATYCSVHADTDAQRSYPVSHDAHADRPACGYCSLASHTPVLVPATASFGAIVWGIQHRLATRFESLWRPPVLTSARPRAPPLSL
ncbi:DUF2946 domain-containing protein (plasmid) [Ralstonia wenshanensis]|nr:DUF2946 domain-containing protein [Ralstonia wenshanensis]UGS88476.1 DUF2946 domain-containing protein [Ralstonia wenshanensis]